MLHVIIVVYSVICPGFSTLALLGCQ